MSLRSDVCVRVYVCLYLYVCGIVCVCAFAECHPEILLSVPVNIATRIRCTWDMF